MNVEERRFQRRVSGLEFEAALAPVPLASTSTRDPVLALGSRWHLGNALNPPFPDYDLSVRETFLPKLCFDNPSSSQSEKLQNQH